MWVARRAMTAAALALLIGGCGPKGDRWGATEADGGTGGANGEAPPAAGEPVADPRCPEGMVFVEGGEFPSGALGEDIDYFADWPGTEHLPREPKVRGVDAFCIDRYEYPNQAGEVPRAFVSWDEAVTLCQEQGRRLCTEDEWTRACAGAKGQRFPYGDTHVVGNCNADVNDRVGDPTWIRPSGSFSRCASAEGAYDLEGNLSEWVDSVAEGLPDQRIIRGGTMWVGVYGRGCFARHRHHQADASHEDDGLRCCAEPPGAEAATDDAEPATPASP